MKRVVIIGGGFTGANTANLLEKKFKVTLIDTKGHFEFTPSILKSITNPKLFNKIKLDHKDYLKNSKIVLGKVEKISSNSVFVGKKEFFFDYLVIASGSSYSPPIKEKNVSFVSRLNHMEKIHEKIGHLKKIVIIGGGPVGVELSSELITSYPDKNLSIFASSDRLLPRNNKKSSKIAKDFLEKKGVKVNLSKKVFIKNKKFTLENGEKVDGDHFFMCTGIKTNPPFFKKMDEKTLNEKNHIKVNHFLQVEGFKNIFAGGDITNTPEEKTAQSAVLHAKLIAKNISNLNEKKKLKSYSVVKRPMVISLGRKSGILEYKNFSLKGVVPAILKKLIEKRELLRLKI